LEAGGVKKRSHLNKTLEEKLIIVGELR